MTARGKVKHTTQSVKGKVEEATGRATGDRSLKAKGKGNQVAANLKQAGENVKDSVRSLKR